MENHNPKEPLTPPADSRSNNLRFAIFAAVAAFVTYLSMYAFRKPFAAATFEGLGLWGLDYKTLLIIMQLVGYTLSKYIGIKVVAELRPARRIATLLWLMGTAWASLLLFGLLPAPLNAVLMLLNGLPLGMIWGIVFSFIEGRRFTELLGAAMASSFIVSSGLVKAVGRWVIENWGVSEHWMPLVTASLFVPLLLLGIGMLKNIAPPTPYDEQLRTARVPMDASARRGFLARFAPGVLLTVLIYVGLTIFRDLRDNFSVEFWQDAGYGKVPQLLALSELPIAFGVLICIGAMFTISNNRTAFFANFVIIVACGLLLVAATLLFKAHTMSALWWMLVAGFAMYLPYIAYHTFLFERWIAHFKQRSNIGFLMYVADAAGYLGSTGVLLYKNFGWPSQSWTGFFEISALAVGGLMIVLGGFAWLYFKRKTVGAAAV